MNREHLKIVVKKTIAAAAWGVEDLFRGPVASITVLGDSHCRYYRHIQKMNPIPGRRIRVFSVTGATASGLANPMSSTRALPAFLGLTAQLHPKSPLVFQLGEVDCGFLIWIKSQERSTSPDEEMRKSLVRYMTFLRLLRTSGQRRIFVSTVSPPTIADWAEWRGPVGHLRRQVSASIEDRAKLTQRFNAALREQAPREGIGFLDVEAQLTDPTTGLVRSNLRSRVAGEIHLDNACAAGVLRTALMRALPIT